MLLLALTRTQPTPAHTRVLLVIPPRAVPPSPGFPALSKGPERAPTVPLLTTATRQRKLISPTLPLLSTEPLVCRFPTYLNLVAASLSSMVKDNSIPKYMTLVKDLHDSTDLDSLMHKVVQHLRTVLGHSNNHHFWYRIGLTAPNNTASTIFDDLTQVRPGGIREESKYGGSRVHSVAAMRAAWTGVVAVAGVEAPVRPWSARRGGGGW